MSTGTTLKVSTVGPYDRTTEGPVGGRARRDQARQQSWRAMTMFRPRAPKPPPASRASLALGPYGTSCAALDPGSARRRGGDQSTGEGDRYLPGRAGPESAADGCSRPPDGLEGVSQRRAAWLDRAGRRLEVVEPPGGGHP